MTENKTNGHLPKLETYGPSSQLKQNGQSQGDELSPDALAEIWARRAYALATPPPAETTGETLELLTFLLGGEYYGLEATYAREIFPLANITPVPRTPEFVVGIFNARGRLISVIDLRAIFGLPSESPSDQSKIIVVATEDMEVGLLADEVTEVLTILKDELEPTLVTQASAQAEYLQGITTDMLVVLDLNALLSAERLIINEEIT